MEENEDIKATKEELDRINQDEILWKEALDIEITRMDNEQFMYEARRDGIIEGKREARLETAKKLLEEKVSIEIIMKVTELTEEEINKLK